MSSSQNVKTNLNSVKHIQSKHLLLLALTFAAIIIPLIIALEKATTETTTTDTTTTITTTSTAPRLPISLLATVTASNFYSGSGSSTSQGNSLVNRTTGGGGVSTGAYPPQYVQLEFPGLYNISSIYLEVGQSPSGVTRHQLSVGSSLSNLSIVTDMNNYTSAGQWINLTYSPVLINIRYLRLDTITSPSWVASIKFIVYDY